MSEVLKTFLSMSLSGSLLILILLAGKALWRNKLSRQWQYYIWLLVILRLLLPFGAEVNVYRLVSQSGGQAASLTVLAQPAEGVPEETASEASPAPHQDVDAISLLGDWLWLVWLAGALCMLVRKITVYQSFARYVSSGSIPVSDPALLDRLARTAELAGVRRPVELWVNPVVASPLLLGCFRPCIVLPGVDLPEKDVHFTVLHELTHYRRRDMLYKWLVQLAVCLHWFNPLVHLMGREITKACEFSCDEAVLTRAGSSCAQDYGTTLLDAMAAVGKYRESAAAVTLSENKQLLKERIAAIMSFQKKSGGIRLMTGVLTVCVLCGASFLGVCRAGAVDSPAPAEKPAAVDAKENVSSSQIEKYYEADSLPLFQLAFSRLGEAEQRTWLERTYEDGKIAFFSAGVNQLKADSPLAGEMAEEAYQDGSVSFFSVLANRMDEDALETWLDRALEDGKWSFQSVLFNTLDRDDEFDKLEAEKEKEWAEAQTEEYRAAGITVDGKNYYYQGKLVNLFLDIRKEGSFYVLDMNPQGTVNVKITRNVDGTIETVGYMTDAEAGELFASMEDEPEIIPVELKTVAAGEAVCLGECTLSEGDQIRYDISAKTGSGMKVYFARNGQKNPVYWSVHNLRQQGEPLRCTADFTVEPPAKSGTYQLFLQASDGALGSVKGNVFITTAS